MLVFSIPPTLTTYLRRSKRLASNKLPTTHLSEEFVGENIATTQDPRAEVLDTVLRENPSQIFNTLSVPITDHTYSPGLSLPAQSTANPPSAAANTTTRRDLLELQLHDESQELEIKKLELQLQLAKLEVSHDNSITARDSTKSLGDAKAPQKTISPQEWPHIFAPGEPKLYNDLTLPEFSASFLVIIQRCEDQTRAVSLFAPFHYLMVLASHYKWSAVRAYQYKVLRSLEMGLVSWGVF